MSDEIDWAAVHLREVVPHRARFRSGTPAIVRDGAALAMLIGVLLLVLLPGSYRLTGLVPLFFGAFVMVMAHRSRDAAEDPAVVRRGTVTGLGRKEQVGNDSRGMSVRRVSFWVELDLTATGELTALSPNLTAASGRVRLGLEEELFESLQEGEEVTALSLPGAAGHVRMLLSRKNPVSQSPAR